MLDYILNRLSEPSTWRGLFLVATAAGVNVSPEQANAIMTLGLGGVGLIGAATKDVR